MGGVRIDDERLKTEYIEGKQTLAQLSLKHGVCVKTIWNRLHSMRQVRVISKYKDVVVNMDTTYWGRGFGRMAIKDTFRNKILWYKFVNNETIADYMEGIAWLRRHGFHIYGIVCDRIRGLFMALYPYPVQMCQFHQMMIVRRYLTNRPELPAAPELLDLTKRITYLDKTSFIAELDLWQERWSEFLKERTRDRTGRSTYTHPRVRSAYLSLRRNMKWLWTFEQYSHLHIPQDEQCHRGNVHGHQDQIESAFGHL